MIRARVQRAKKQRLYLLAVTNNSEGFPSFAVLGSTGNVYTVWFQSGSPKCNCVDHRVRWEEIVVSFSFFLSSLYRRTLCKHIIFVLLRILKVPEKQIEKLSAGSLCESELQRFLTNVTVPVEERYIAPRNTLEDFKSIVGDLDGALSSENRSPVPRREGNTECPICFEDFSTEDVTEPILYCKWGCGNAVHKDCFDKWSASKVEAGQEVTCVYCRTLWDRRESSKTGVKQILRGRRIIKLHNPYEKENVLVQRALSSKSSKKSREVSAKVQRKKKPNRRCSESSQGSCSNLKRPSRKRGIDKGRRR